jgi:alkane 1-monooxygenase
MASATWRDGKRYAWLLGVLLPTLPFMVYALVQLTGWGVFWFFGADPDVRGVSAA